MGRKKKTICTFDCETDPFKLNRHPEPFTVGFYRGDIYVDFWGKDCFDQFIDYLKDEKDLIIYAHNGGKFDIFFMLEHLDPELMIINGRIVKATIFDGAIEIRDSYSIIPIPLNSYKKDDVDYGIFEKEVRNLPKNKRVILEYQKADCVYLHELVFAFNENYGNKLTLASAAFNELKKTGYEVSRSFNNYDEKFRPFYFGGRVQCFKVGNFYEPVEYVDINSAYSKSMLENHWYGNQYIQKLRIPDSENGSYFADILAVSYGALPIKHEVAKNDFRLIFPSDDKPRRYKVTGHEIIVGLKTGTLKIKKVYSVYKPLFTRNFSEYVNHFFELKDKAKKEGDKIMYLFAKFFLNACYGKFGQDGRKFKKFVIEDYGNWPENDPNWEHDFRWKPYCDAPENKRIFYRDDPSEKFFNVSTAASVTGWVRAYLWENICSSDTPYYCDTDSIMCKKFNGNISDKIGDWGIECIFNDVHIAQKKMYSGSYYKKEWPFVDYKVASKGVRFNEDIKNQYEEIKNGIKYSKEILVKKDSPAYSLKFPKGRFLEKSVSFKNIYKNLVENQI